MSTNTLAVVVELPPSPSETMTVTACVPKSAMNELLAPRDSLPEGLSNTSTIPPMLNVITRRSERKCDRAEI